MNEPLPASLVRLAQALGKTPEELAENFGPETVKAMAAGAVRTVYDDGTEHYQHDVIDRNRSR